MKKILAIAVATAISAPAMADLTIGGGARYSVTDVDGNVATDGRVSLTVAGSATGANGATAGYNLSMQANQDDTDGLVIEDNYLNIGNEMVTVKLGSFEMTKVFAVGADTFVANADDTSNGYTASAVRGRASANIEVLASAGAFDLGFGTRIDDAEQNAQLSAKTTFGTVSVGAVYEVANAGTDDGLVLTAGTTLEGVTLNASYGKKGEAKATNVNASYSGFGIAYQINENGTANDEETNLYGTYTVADVAGIAGASLIIGAGNSETALADSDKVGVRLNYAF
jgi:hypothetical protein